MNTPIKAFSELKGKGFKIHEIAETANPSLPYGRRDFYKIVLVTGDMTIYYGDQRIEINGTFLFFAHPHVPHSVIQHSQRKERTYSHFHSLATEWTGLPAIELP
jgi:hypothetical protein